MLGFHREALVKHVQTKNADKKWCIQNITNQINQLEAGPILVEKSAFINYKGLWNASAALQKRFWQEKLD